MKRFVRELWSRLSIESGRETYIQKELVNSLPSLLPWS
jgi:hypothetical protein